MSQIIEPNEYFLFLDESGKFKETSTDPAELESSRQDKRNKKIRSQLVGFLARREKNISEQAQIVLDESYRGARVQPGKKGSDLTFQELNEIIPRLVKKLQQKQWQPVPLVNEEKVTYGSRVSIYTNMVAELLLRIFQSKAKNPQDPISICLVASNVQLEKMDKNDARIYTPPNERWRRIKHESYKQRIEEALGFAAVRRGLSRNQLNWKLYDVSLEDARRVPELQICDLLSNASKERYGKCSASNKTLLQQAFNVFDQTMQTSDVLERLDSLVNKQALSSALMILGEAFISDDETDYFKTVAANQLDFVLERMVQIGPRGRDAHLSVLIAWLDQLIGQERLLDAGYKIARWLKEDVLISLRDKLKPLNQQDTLVWFEFAIHAWLLTGANHRGALQQAHDAAESIGNLSSSLAQQSEHLPLLIDGLIAQAVHQTDSFDFETPIKNLKQIAALLRLQTQSLSKLMPKPLEDRLRSDALAKTLGTLTMSLILAGFKNKLDADYAREQSNKAIDEFARLQDKERQYQYRCHLETLTGNFAAARWFLMKSLSPVDEAQTVSHEELLRAIVLLEKELHFKYFFTLAHWLRIGAWASRQRTPEQKAEFQAFCEIFNRSQFLQKYLSKDFSQNFPAHLILKNIAVIQSARGQSDSAFQVLQQLDKITELNTNYLILPIIQAGAYAEVAANLWNNPASHWLLDSHTTVAETKYQPKKGIKQIFEEMLNNDVGRFPALNVKVQDWQLHINQLISETATPSKSQKILLKIADEIRY